MSQEPEDVKPKLNLNICYDHNVVTVKVKPNMKFSKIFAAAEERFRRDPGTLRFTFEGSRLRPEETPADVGVEDGDQIDAHLPQVGGYF